jgi:hypothetical protein
LRTHEITYENCKICGKSIHLLHMPKHIRDIHSGMDNPCVIPGWKFQSFNESKKLLNFFYSRMQ